MSSKENERENKEKRNDLVIERIKRRKMIENNDPFSFIEKLEAAGDKTTFGYMRRKKGCAHDMTPASLEIVSYSKARSGGGGDIYTISLNGITKISGGKPEFMTLEQWKKEFELLKHLEGITFFKTFAQATSFHLWKSNIMKRKYNHASKLLATRSPLLAPDSVLTAIHDKVDDLRAIEMNLLDFSKSQPLIDIQEQYKCRLDQIKDDISAVVDEIRSILKSDCGKREKVVIDRMTEARDLERKRMRHKLRREKIDYAQMVEKKRDFIQLSKFVRLVDYILKDALIGMVMNVVHYLERNLRLFDNTTMGPESTTDDVALSEERLLKKPPMCLEVVLKDEEAVFSPNIDELFEALIGMIKQAADTFSFGRFQYEEDFKKFFNVSIIPGTELEAKEASIDSSDDMTEIFNYGELEKKKKAMRDILGRCYSKAEKEISKHKGLIESNTQNKQQNLENKNVEYFESALESLNKQQQEIYNLPESVISNLFELSLEKLSKQLLPTTQKCINEICIHLPKFLSQACEELSSNVNDIKDNATRELASDTDTLEFLKYNVEVDSKIEKVDDLFAFTTSVNNIIEKHTVSLSPVLVVKYQILCSEVTDLKKVVQSAKDRVDEVTENLKSSVKERISVYKSEIEELKSEMSSGDILKYNDKPEIQQKELHDKLESCKAIIQEGEDIHVFQEYLSEEALLLDQGRAVMKDIALKKSIWDDISNWKDFIASSDTTAMKDVDLNAMEAIDATLNRNLRKYTEGKLNGTAILELRGYQDILSSLIPFLQDMQNVHLKERHWLDIRKITGIEIPISHSSDKLKDLESVEGEENALGPSLSDIMRLDIDSVKNDVSAVVDRAVNEDSIEKVLRQTVEQWSSLDFETSGIEHQNDVLIVKNFEDLTLLLDESMITLSTVRSSKFVGPVKQEAETFFSNLKTAAESIEEWIEVQKKWLYLESIFSYPDIQRQLPMETKTFFNADRTFRTFCRRLAGDPNVIRFTTEEGFVEVLKNCILGFERVEKGLEDYLDTKRLIFSRFCFLSNEELIEILSESRNPVAVQPHLNKCFENIHRLEFKREGRMHSILGMKSVEGEYVAFKKAVVPRGSAEIWLQNVEKAMNNVLKEKFKQAVEFFPVLSDLRDFLFSFPAQIVIGVFQLFWTRTIQMHLAANSSDGPGGAIGNPASTKAALQSYREELSSKVDSLVAIVKEDLTKLQRGLVTALMTISVHARDVLDHLIEEGVSSADSFQWKKNLRYYWDADKDDCIVVQNNGSIDYGYEYLGCSPRLVITPLTDRCYVTLTEALRLKLGGSPSGPAGTGKTETVKDLAKAIAKQCIVYNCNEAVNVKTMASFFSGISQSGAWICFDEFNRIDVEVLSVIAQQILTLRNALSAGQTTLLFEGKQIRLNSTLGYFITMNPGYAGRTELPDNLKVLFRPVAMMVPDYSLIAEIILFSEGFLNARELSRKMTQLYKLSSEQLSKQSHYDFGLRALKSILVMAGALKRDNQGLDEDVVLIRAMRNANIPKFVKRDIPVFLGLISDLFPRVKVTDKCNDVLEARIIECMRLKGLDYVPSIVQKTMQLYDTLRIRHGVMLVGPASSGKTTCREILADALNSLHSEDANAYVKVRDFVLNPKSISIQELYGEYNEVTHEWTDGIITVLARRCVADTTEDEKWIVFDGPVDALWIENMNSVLDDNKLLCLGNGERIKLTSSIRMIFEVKDLAVASPATVSRCGMVYLNREDLTWRSTFKKWLGQFQRLLGGEAETSRERGAKTAETASEGMLEGLVDHIETLFSSHVQNGVDFLRKEKLKITFMEFTDINLVGTCCGLLESLLLPNWPTLKRLGQKQRLDLVSMAFVYSYAWALGGVVEGSKRGTVFADFVLNELSTTCPLPAPSDTASTVFDYFVDMAAGTYVQWETVIPQTVFDKSTSFKEMIVPTVELLQHVCLAKLLGKRRKPVLFIGNSGVGKTVFMERALRELSEEQDAGEGGGGSFNYHAVNFSAQTSSWRLQQQIEALLERKAKNKLAPPGSNSNTLVVMIDDLNMPFKEEYGAQPPIELLRFLQGSGCLYDRKKLFLKHVDNVVLFAACGPPGGGRNELTDRLTEQFSVFYLPDPSPRSLKHIYGSILRNYLSSNAKIDRDGTENSRIVDFVRHAYRFMREKMLPTPAKIHYTFSVRDLGNVFQGILQMPVKKLESAQQLIRLALHEVMRVFHDRLITESDRVKVVEKLEEMRDEYGYVSSGRDISSLVFSPKVNEGEKDVIPYCEMDLPIINKLVKNYVADHSDTQRRGAGSGSDDLVVFSEFSQHFSRIMRVLLQKSGHLLLLGVSGVGKQSVTKLVAKTLGYSIEGLDVCKGYGMNEFKDDMKRIYTACAMQETPSVLILGENSIIDERFLEDVNSLLNSGEIPNLYDGTELEGVLADFQSKYPTAAAAYSKDAVGGKEGGGGSGGGGNSRKDLIAAYFGKVKDNLHVVLGMDPTGERFRNRCQQFPYLVNCCTIDYFDNWRGEALLSVVRSKLAGLEGLSEGESGAGTREALCLAMRDIHSSMESFNASFYEQTRRRNYTTPSSFLSFIDLFALLLKEKNDELATNIRRMSNGVERLLQTNDVVGEMQKGLKELQPELEEKAKNTDVIIKQLAKEEKKVEDVKAVVQEEEEVVNKQAEEANAIATDAQNDLDVVMPILEEAVDSLNSLNKSDITEVKSFKTPPELVRTVLESVCVLKQLKPDWDTSKKMLGDSQFLQSLKTFDKDSISEGTIKKLKKYIENPNFNPELVQKVSSAATSLCKWVRAIYNYHGVAKVVAPKKERLRHAQEELAKAQGTLKQKQDKLAEIEAELGALKGNLDKSLREKTDLEEKMQKTSERLDNAKLLITALSEEQVRWKETVIELKKQRETVNGDILLSAAFISYLGVFNSEFRKKIVAKWVEAVANNNIQTSGRFSISSVLTNRMEVRNWESFGLPTDGMSVENAIITLRARNWPLIVDPQFQAMKWIRNMEEDHGLKVVRLSEENYVRSIENSMRIGTPVLIEDVGENIDPSLMQIIVKKSNVGGRSSEKGDGAVCDPNFRLYLTTRLPNPSYLPEQYINFAIINFTVTPVALSDQILDQVSKVERPDLEEQRVGLAMSITREEQLLLDIENKVLKSISEAQGSILDNTVLIKHLNEAKETSKRAKEKLREAEIAEAELTRLRERYREVAVTGSSTYFTMISLSNLSSFYQFSLDFFTKLLKMALEEGKRTLGSSGSGSAAGMRSAGKSEEAEAGELEKRLRGYCELILRITFLSTSRGLFEKDKQIFAFMLAVQESKELDWTTFFRLPGSSTAAEEHAENPLSAYMDGEKWQLLKHLCTSVPSLQGVEAGIMEAPDDWGRFLASSDFAGTDSPIIPSPSAAARSLNCFEKLCVAKYVKAEALVQQVAALIEERLGKEYTSSVMDLDAAFNSTSPDTPLIFVLTSGADPTPHIMKLRATASSARSGSSSSPNHGTGMHIVSLGQGQGPIATEHIKQSAKNGDWVVLQNCHLAISWMPKLEQLIDQMRVQCSRGGVHDNFRLLLTTMPSPAFPQTVLQSSMKLTIEPAKGIRANMVHLLRSAVEERDKEEFGNLHFSLVFMHTLLQERRKFGPIGWNKQYEFNEGDLAVSLLHLREFLQQKVVDWEALRYVIGEINYGGRVTDDIDRRLLNTVTERMICTEATKEGYNFGSGGDASDASDTSAGIVSGITDEGAVVSNKVYHTLSTQSHPLFLEYASSLPPFEDPDVFGLHRNVDDMYLVSEGQKVINGYLSCQGMALNTSMKGGNDLKDMMLAVETQIPDPVEEIEINGPDDAADDASSAAGEDGSDEEDLTDSLDIVLFQEIEKYNTLISIMKITIKEAVRAVEGYLVMNGEIEQFINEVKGNAMPSKWKPYSFLCAKKMDKWLEELNQRIRFIRNWREKGVPRFFWFPAFFFPQGFLIAVLQNYARKHLISIDSLKFSFSFLDYVVPTGEEETSADAPPPLEDGAYVYGLQLEGARWSKEDHLITDVESGKMHYELPLIQFLPIPEKESKTSAADIGKHFSCPLYRTGDRAGTLSTTGHSTNYIMDVTLPTDDPPSKWVLRGVAALVSN